MLTSSEWEIEMEYNRKYEQHQRELRHRASDRNKLLKGAAWGILYSAVIVAVAYGIVNWIVN